MFSESPEIIFHNAVISRQRAVLLRPLAIKESLIARRINYRGASYSSSNVIPQCLPEN